MIHWIYLIKYIIFFAINVNLKSSGYLSETPHGSEIYFPLCAAFQVEHICLAVMLLSPRFGPDVVWHARSLERVGL
jgi:hypothetical protein